MVAIMLSIRVNLKILYWLIFIFICSGIIAFDKNHLPEVRYNYRHQNEISRAQILPGTNYIVSGGYDKTIRLFPLTRSRGNVFYRTRYWLYDFAISPNQNYIVYTTARKHSIRLLRWKKRKLLKTLRGHRSTVRGICFDKSGKYLYSIADDKKFIKWNLHTGAKVWRKTINDAYISHLIRLRNGFIAAAGMKYVYILDNVHYTIQKKIPIRMQVLDVYYRAKDNLFVLAGNPMYKKGGNSLYTIDLTTNEVRSINTQNKIIHSVALSSDGKLIACGADHGFVEWLSHSDGKTLLKKKVHVKPVISVGFSEDGEKFFSASLDGVLKVWY